MHDCFPSIIYKKGDKSKGFRLFMVGQGTEVILEQFLKRAALIAKRNFHNGVFTAETVGILYVPDKILYPIRLFHSGVYFDITDVNQISDINCLNVCLA